MQPSTRSLLNISDRLVEHVAHQATFLGLDDEEEQLLWRYFAIRGADTPREVLECLHQQGQLQAYDMVDVQVQAHLPAKWVKPEGLLKRTQDLHHTCKFTIENDQVVFGDYEQLLKKRLQHAQYQAFEIFYPRLTRSIANGVSTWPGSDSVDIQLIGAPRHLNHLIRNIMGV